MTAFTTKLPARGDKVIDNNRVIKKEGIIKSGVFDTDPTDRSGTEKIKDAFVEFSHADTDWYTVDKLQDCWVEDQQAYVLEEK